MTARILGARKPRVVLLACSALSALTAVPAAAQDQTGQTIETVTVTAQKRSQNILDVGINVTAITSDEIQQSRIMTPTDLMSQVPNLEVKDNIPGAQQIITIRGIGLDDFSTTNNSTVGIYVDDIYLASFAEEDFNFFDLDRIEVLKGPQAALYGRNTTAGAINIISAQPSFDGLFGNVSAGYGNYDAFQSDAMINVPVTGNFALRFAGETIQQDRGYWYSTGTDKDLGRQHDWFGRGQALWDPTGAISVLLKVEGTVEGSQIGVGKFFGTQSTNTQSCPDYGNPAHCVNYAGYTDTNPNVFEGDWTSPAFYREDALNTTLHVTDDFGWGTLTSVTGYIQFRRSFLINAGASPTQDADFDENDRVNQFSEELRLAGNADGVQWLVGADYSWDQIRDYTPGSLADSFGLDVLITADQITHYAAGFAQVDWPLVDHLTLSSGVRLAYEDRSYVGGSNWTIAGTTTAFPLFDTSENDTISDRAVDFREALNWKPGEDTLVYASVSRGTKSGGFFDGISTQDQALAPYKPETLTDYETGVKSEFFNDTVLLDSSVFYYDYRDLQAQTFTTVGAVALIKLSNIQKANVYGLDAALTWLPLDGLSLRGGLGLLHSRLGSFPYASVSGPTTEPSGNQLPDAPDVTFNGTARYEHSLFSNYVGAVQFSGVYAADSFLETLNTPFLFSKANWVFDGRTSIGTNDKSWELAFWIKNMFNEQHVVQATDDGAPLDEGYRIFNAPRTYGFTLTYAFQ
ncbi:MAG TPA: TonB-dependent receptor [Rhizomicrobium sp.]|nr:TonB-dependent receptor [Rhizomicrobium sp.]